MRAALTMVLFCCGGAAAQEVLLDGVPLAKVPATQAERAPFGADGVISRMPWWLDQPEADYFGVPTFASKSLRLIPDSGGLAPGRDAAELSSTTGTRACGRGWAKSPGPHTCISKLRGVPSNAWGWTNKITQGTVYTDIPVYIGASQCTGGHHRFNINVKYEGSSITVDLSNGGKNSLRSAAVYVGQSPLPMTRSGRYSGSPGQFPVAVNVNDNPRVTFDDLDGGEYYFAVHVNACLAGDDEVDTPAPETDVPRCPSTFYITQYHCPHGPCSDGIEGSLGAKLRADEWESLKGYGPWFTIEATGNYYHETRVFKKVVDEEVDTPDTDGTTAYIGIFATGCGEALSEPSYAPKPGPVRALCRDYCPPGSAGFTGVALE